jgi:hypothetical protein
VQRQRLRLAQSVAVRLNGSGYLRLEGKGNKIVDSADVADDTWHHVAVPCRFL